MNEIYETLNNIYEDRIKPLKLRRAEISKTLDALSDTNREKVLNAQISVLSRKIEEETALGNLDQARNFESELATVQTELEALIETKKFKRKELLEELDLVGNEIKSIAQRVINESFHGYSAAFLVRINEVLDFVDAVRAGFGQFAGENGSGMPTNYRERFRPHVGGNFGEDYSKLRSRFQKVGWLP